ncbi:glycosyltransferase family 4 protein [Terrihabitans rhizophilus]|uniref:Glycosyltransferase family 4 protein n=1 Tax=Terrihabitans rhizophilus TaxID=3092662 RepID=A0ABU4RTY4_9HYPH|nr:glycosyltransferase family 4 protein [Terrihabitans sp. PJ23]MDX6807090.1 glycosyltransferase family 4 protein [Terrihabitans sp. PJ23]
MTDGAPLRIIHVFRAPLGGLFRHVMDLARGQVDAGHQVGILCDSVAGNPRDHEKLEALEPELALGLRRMPMARVPSLHDRHALTMMAAFHREARPDVIHGHGAKGGAFARLPGFYTRGWPVTCYTPHGGSFHYAPGTAVHRVYTTAERILARRTGALLMESHFIARKVRETLGQVEVPIHVVHNGISESEFAPVTRSADAADLLYVGELRFEKGVDTVLDALAMLSEEGLRPTIRIQGSGPHETALHDRVRSLGLAEQVRFAPAGPVREGFENARIMIVPSRKESLPYVVLEAAGAGVPLISTDVGGIPEIFGPFSDRLIPAGEPPVLRDAIRAALRQPEQELRRNAEELALFVRGNFAMSRMISEVEDAYRRALATRADLQRRH